MSLFNEENTTTTTEGNGNENNAAALYAQTLAEKLVNIKRDDGTPKYASVEDALDALLHSQTHIRTLESDNASLKTEAQKAKDLEATLARLQGSGNQEQPSRQTNTGGGLSEEAARQIARDELQRTKNADSQLNNLKSVNEQLIKKYGSEEKAKEAVKLKAAQLDMTLKELEELTKVKPKAVLAYFGESYTPTVSTNSSTIRVPSTTGAVPELVRPEKSLLSGPGATGKNQTDYLKQVRERIMQKIERGELT